MSTTEKVTKHADEVFSPCNRNTIKCPRPGVYHDFTMEDYHKIDAVNASTLKKFMVSGKHGKMYLEGKQDPPSNAMLFGTAAHSRIFEPDDYAERAIEGLHKSDKGKPLADGCAWSKHKAVQDENPDNIILHAGWSRRIEAIAEQVEGNPETLALFRHPDSLREVTLIWEEVVEFGDTKLIVPFKARLDMFNKAAQVIPDLKTTTSAEPPLFRKKSYDLGYHISGAIYVRGCLQLGLMARDEHGRIPAGAYLILAAETSAPHITSPYAMQIEAMEQGFEDAWQIGLSRLVKYRTLGVADGPEYKMGEDEYGDPITIGSDKITDLDLPAWAQRETAGDTIKL